MSDQNDLRLELRIRNLALWNAIHRDADSVAAFCRMHQLGKHSHIAVYELLAFRRSPYARRDPEHPSPLADKLCVITGIPHETLFPRHLYEKSIPRLIVREESSHRLISLSSREARMLPAPEPSPLPVVAAIHEALDLLTPKQRIVVESRFGLGPEHEELDLMEIAEKMGLSRARVGQLQHGALERLRKIATRKGMAP